MVVVAIRLCRRSTRSSNEVILLERVSVFRAFGRSRALSRGFEGELSLPGWGRSPWDRSSPFVSRWGARRSSSVLAGDELTWDRPGLSDLSGLLFQAAVWIAVAYFGVFRFLSYIDRRIRLEGWEMELRLKAVGRALEERPQ